MPTGSYTDVLMRFRILKRYLQYDDLFIQRPKASQSFKSTHSTVMQTHRRLACFAGFFTQLRRIITRSR